MKLTEGCSVLKSDHPETRPIFIKSGGMVGQKNIRSGGRASSMKIRSEIGVLSAPLTTEKR